RHLVGESRLARAGVADDDEEAATAGQRIVEAGLEEGQFLVAADQRRGRQTARLRTPPDLGRYLPRRQHVERRVLGEDGALELLQRPPGLDAELRRERPPGVAVGLEGLGLPSCPVQRE